MGKAASLATKGMLAADITALIVRKNLHKSFAGKIVQRLVTRPRLAAASVQRSRLAAPRARARAQRSGTRAQRSGARNRRQNVTAAKRSSGHQTSSPNARAERLPGVAAGPSDMSSTVAERLSTSRSTSEMAGMRDPAAEHGRARSDRQERPLIRVWASRRRAG